MLKKQKTRLVTISVVFVLGIVLAACSPGSPLVGKWEDPDDPGPTIEFKSDGSFEISNSGETIEGTYEVVDADTFNVTISILGAGSLETQVVDFVRAGDTLTLTYEDESSIEFHKVP